MAVPSPSVSTGGDLSLSIILFYPPTAGHTAIEYPPPGGPPLCQPRVVRVHPFFFFFPGHPRSASGCLFSETCPFSPPPARNPKKPSVFPPLSSSPPIPRRKKAQYAFALPTLPSMRKKRWRRRRTRSSPFLPSRTPRRDDHARTAASSSPAAKKARWFFFFFPGRHQSRTRL